MDIAALLQQIFGGQAVGAGQQGGGFQKVGTALQGVGNGIGTIGGTAPTAPASPAAPPAFGGTGNNAAVMALLQNYFGRQGRRQPGVLPPKNTGGGNSTGGAKWGGGNPGWASHGGGYRGDRTSGGSLYG